MYYKNERSTSKDILKTALIALNRVTGVATDEPHSAVERRANALITIKTDQGETQFVAEIKTVDRFQTPAQVKSQLAQYAEHPLLVAPFISRETGEHCRDLHLSFIE